MARYFNVDPIQLAAQIGLAPQQQQQAPVEQQGLFGDVVDAAQMGAANSVGGILDFVGARGLAKSFYGIADDQVNQMSDAGRTALQKDIITRDEAGDLALGEGATDLDTWILNFANLVGNAGATMVPGGLAAKGLQLGRLGTAAAFGATGGSAATGMAAEQGRDEIRNMAPELLTKSPLYAEIRQLVEQQYGGEDDATKDAIVRESLAETVANEIKSDPKQLIANFAGSALADPIIGRALTGARIAKGGIKSGMLRGALVEGGTESAQAGVSQYGVNEAVQPFDGRGLYDNVAEAALTEGILAGGFGAAAGGFGGAVNRQARDVKASNPAPQITSSQAINEAIGSLNNNVTNAQIVVDAPTAAPTAVPTAVPTADLTGDGLYDIPTIARKQYGTNLPADMGRIGDNLQFSAAYERADAERIAKSNGDPALGVTFDGMPYDQRLDIMMNVLPKNEAAAARQQALDDEAAAATRAAFGDVANQFRQINTGTSPVQQALGNVSPTSAELTAQTMVDARQQQADADAEAAAQATSAAFADAARTVKMNSERWKRRMPVPVTPAIEGEVVAPESRELVPAGPVKDFDRFTADLDYDTMTVIAGQDPDFKPDAPSPRMIEGQPAAAAEQTRAIGWNGAFEMPDQSGVNVRPDGQVYPDEAAALRSPRAKAAAKAGQQVYAVPFGDGYGWTTEAPAAETSAETAAETASETETVPEFNKPVLKSRAILTKSKSYKEAQAWAADKDYVVEPVEVDGGWSFEVKKSEAAQDAPEPMPAAQSQALYEPVDEATPEWRQTKADQLVSAVEQRDTMDRVRKALVIPGQRKGETKADYETRVQTVARASAELVALDDADIDSMSAAELSRLISTVTEKEPKFKTAAKLAPIVRKLKADTERNALRSENKSRWQAAIVRLSNGQNPVPLSLLDEANKYFPETDGRPASDTPVYRTGDVIVARALGKAEVGPEGFDADVDAALEQLDNMGDLVGQMPDDVVGRAAKTMAESRADSPFRAFPVAALQKLGVPTNLAASGAYERMFRDLFAGTDRGRAAIDAATAFYAEESKLRQDKMAGADVTYDSATGEYTVEYKGQTRRIFRDNGVNDNKGWWYRLPVEGESYGDATRYTIGFTKEDAVAEIKKQIDTTAGSFELVVKYGGGGVRLALDKPLTDYTKEQFSDLMAAQKINTDRGGVGQLFEQERAKAIVQKMKNGEPVADEVAAEFPYIVRSDLSADEVDQMLDDLRDTSGADRTKAMREYKPKLSAIQDKPVRGMPTDRVIAIVDEQLAKIGSTAGISVRVVPSQDRFDFISDRVRAKGFYDPRSKEVVLIAENLGNATDVKRTLLHELLAHGGLDMVIGADATNKILDKIQGTRNSPSFAELWDWADRNYKGTDDRIKAEEIFARFTETAPEKGSLQYWWNNLVNQIRRILNDLGLWSSDMTKADMQATLDAIVAGFRENRQSVRALAGDSQVRFSQTAQADYDTMASPEVDRILQKAHSSVLTKAKDAFMSNTLVDKARANLTAFLTLGQLAETSRKLFNNGSMDKYHDTYQQYIADVQGAATDASIIANDIQRWASSNKQAAQAMYELAHDATIYGIDADPKVGDVTPLPLLEKRLTELRAELAEAQQQELTQKVKELRKAIRTTKQEIADFDQGFLDRRVQLRDRFNALPKEAQDYYRTLRKAYEDRRNSAYSFQKKELAAAVQEAKDAGNTAAYRSAKRALDRLMLEQQIAQLSGPYFPLTRHGEYFIDLVDPKGERVFLMQESKAEMETAVAAFEKEGWTITSKGKIAELAREDGISGDILDQLGKIVDNSGLENEQADALRDQIYQLYLQYLPSRSIRKNLIHRKGVRGFDQDAVRSFALSMSKSSNQIARMKHLPAFTKALREAGAQVRGYEKDGSASDAAKSRELLEELRKRHENIMNPDESKVAQAITGLGFTWLLGLSPAAAVINLTQTATVAAPVMAAELNISVPKAMALLAGNLKDMKLTKSSSGERLVSLRNSLTDPAEKAAYRELERMGVIDLTRAHDLVGISETGGFQYGGKFHKAMAFVSKFFHNAEVINREVTAMAVYRLAKQQGKTHGEAVKLAADVTRTSHFDYSSGNRARFMQGNFAKVAFQFKQYSQQMSYYLIRNTLRSLPWNDLTPAERKAARTQLMGTLMTTGVIGGIAALPTGLLFALVNAVVPDDDDEAPFDAKTALYTFLAQNFGKDVANVAIYGAGGAGLSSRIQLNELWLRDPSKNLESSEAYSNYIMQLLGPAFGGIFPSMVKGADLLSEGEYQKGIEKMVPKAIKDLSVAQRYADEGATTLRGDVIKEDFSYLSLFLQANGLADSEVTARYEENAALKGVSDRLRKRRQSLMDQFYEARVSGDEDAMNTVRESIARFNEKNPTIRISGANLRQSLRSRQRRTEQTTKGLYLDKDLAYLQDRIDWL